MMDITGTIFLFIIGLGLLGNIFVFVNYFCLFYCGNKKNYIHLILLHLTFTHIMLLFCKTLRKPNAIFGWSNFLDDAGCQILAYLERVARGHSICTTSLLTMVQAITMSPRSSMLAKFKLRSAWHLLPFFVCLWILSCLISMKLLSYSRNVRNLNKSVILDNYCVHIEDGQTLQWMFLMFMALRDGLFQSLMGCASVYILFLLYKHHQQVLPLRNSRLRPQTPPEVRAAGSVLLLMGFFLIFNLSEYFLTLSFSSELSNITVTLNIIDMFIIGYSTVSPFVLIHRDGKRIRFWHT